MAAREGGPGQLARHAIRMFEEGEAMALTAWMPASLRRGEESGEVSGRHVRLLIADDHDLFREGLRQLLETVPSVEVIGEASDGQEAIQLVAELQPDVVLMDINMPRVDGIRATEY